MSSKSQFTQSDVSRQPNSQGSLGDRDEDVSPMLKTGFMVTVVAAMMAMGSGVYFLIGNGFEIPSLGFSQSEDEPLVFGSALVPVCGKDWMVGFPNVDQMHCYMTKIVNRLCSKKEHGALIAAIERYDVDYMVWRRKTGIADLKSIGGMQVQSLQIGMEQVKAYYDVQNAKYEKSRDAAQDRMFEVGDMVNGVMKNSNDLNAEWKHETPFYPLEDDLAVLAKLGFISAADLGRSKPGFVATGLKNAGKEKIGCLNRS